jgi:predicted transcriptional regulator
MQRLTVKRYLTRRKQGGVHRYSTTAERRTVIRGFIERFVKRVLDGSPAPFVAYLAESGDLTQEQAAALRSIARELKDQAEEEGP